MSIPVKNFLKARRDRALGTILGYIERELFDARCECGRPKVSPDSRTKLRQIVLDSLNSYHDSALDLFKSDVDSLHNDELVALLTRVNDRLDQVG